VRRDPLPPIDIGEEDRWFAHARTLLMFALKRFVRSPGAVIALVAACFSTGAHAGWDGDGWGVGPNNNGWGIGGPTNNGFRGPIDNGPRAGAVGTFRGVGSRQNFGLNPYTGWGMGPYNSFFGVNPQQNVGIPGSDFGPMSFGVGRDFGPINGYVFGLAGDINGWGMAPQQNVGFMGQQYSGYGGGAAAASFGFNPYIGYGIPGSNFGPMSFGVVNPWGGGGWGMNPQQNVGFGPFPALGMYPQQNAGLPVFNPWMGMNPYAQMPMQAVSAQQQGGLQGVQCTINGVGVLTKDADDCEKAGGEVAKAKTAKQ
jgi:hypothetical protein